MCVFTDKKTKALAFALVPILAINVYVGCKMLTKTTKNIQEGDQTSIEEMVDENIIQGDAYLKLDQSVAVTDSLVESSVVQTNQNNSGIDSSSLVDQLPMIDIVQNEIYFSKLNELYVDSGLDYERIICKGEKHTDLYAAALYVKLKACSIPDDIIKHELQNIIVCGSNATCVSEEVWNEMFGHLDSTISMYDNVVDYYYPLAKYVHLQSCDLEHEPIFFDEYRIKCSKIQELYNLWNPEIDIEDYFKEMVEATGDEILIQKYNRLLGNGIAIEVFLTELENIYLMAQIPTCVSEEDWLNLFGNLEKTVEPTENVCIYYYDLAFYLHDLACDLEHHLNEFDRYTCDAYSLTYEI